MKIVKNLVLSLILISAFVLFLVLIKLGYSFKMDQLNIMFANSRTNFFNIFFKIITLFGEWYFLLLASFLFLLFSKDKKLALLFLSSLLIVIALNLIVKFSVQRARPSEMLIKESSFSFPSAHAMCSLIFYGFIVCLIKNSKQKSSIKAIAMIFIVLLIFLIGLSRVYLNVHYFSDVLAGFLLSGVCLIWLIYIKGVIVDNKSKNNIKS